MGIYVVKGGGSLFRDSTGYARFADYVAKKSAANKVVPVLSAPYGFTDELKDIASNMQDKEYRESRVGELRQRCEDLLCPVPTLFVASAMNEIDEQLELINIYADLGASDAIIGSAEYVSAIILSAHLEALDLTARPISGPDAGFRLKSNRSIDMEASRELLKKTIDDALVDEILVLGGYLGRHVDSGQYMTGTRNSTDEFAVGVGDAVDAHVVEIIKDVAGVHRVDPRYGNYGILNHLSYDESGKMTWKGSPVVHPSAIKIARTRGMSLIVKDLESEGTVISNGSQTTYDNPVAAIVGGYQPMITIVDNSMDLEESTGYLAKVIGFETEKGHSIGIDASGHVTISYTVQLGDVKVQNDIRKLNALLDPHLMDLKAYLNSIGREPDTVAGDIVGVITVVGDGLQQRAGMLERIYSVPPKIGVSVRSNVQSDEKYTPPAISFTVDTDKLEPTTKALCEELFSA